MGGGGWWELMGGGWWELMEGGWWELMVEWMVDWMVIESDDQVWWKFKAGKLMIEVDGCVIYGENRDVSRLNIQNVNLIIC